MKKIILFLIAALTSLTVLAQKSPSNPKNPSDYMGRIHNDLVQQFIATYGGTTLPTAMVLDNMQKIANSNPEFAALPKSSKPVPMKYIEMAKTDYKNNFRNVVSTLGLSKTAQREVQALIDYHFNLGFAKAKTSYEDYFKYIVKIEDRVIADKSIIADDKNIILAGTAIARHSIHMWEGKHHGGPGFWGYFFIGVCDVVGGVVGYYTGGQSGSAAINQGSAWSVEANDTVKGKRD